MKICKMRGKPCLMGLVAEINKTVKLLECVAWWFCMMRQLIGCSTPAQNLVWPSSEPKELAQTMKKNINQQKIEEVTWNIYKIEYQHRPVVNGGASRNFQWGASRYTLYMEGF